MAASDLPSPLQLDYPRQETATNTALKLSASAPSASVDWPGHDALLLSSPDIYYINLRKDQDGSTRRVFFSGGLLVIDAKRQLLKLTGATLGLQLQGVPQSRMVLDASYDGTCLEAVTREYSARMQRQVGPSNPKPILVEGRSSFVQDLDRLRLDDVRPQT